MAALRRLGDGAEEAGGGHQGADGRELAAQRQADGQEDAGEDHLHGACERVHHRPNGRPPSADLQSRLPRMSTSIRRGAAGARHRRAGERAAGGRGRIRAAADGPRARGGRRAVRRDPHRAVRLARRRGRDRLPRRRTAAALRPVGGGRSDRRRRAHPDLRPRRGGRTPRRGAGRAAAAPALGGRRGADPRLGRDRPDHPARRRRTCWRACSAACWWRC